MAVKIWQSFRDSSQILGDAYDYCQLVPYPRVSPPWHCDPTSATKFYWVGADGVISSVKLLVRLSSVLFISSATDYVLYLASGGRLCPEFRPPPPPPGLCPRTVPRWATSVLSLCTPYL